MTRHRRVHARLALAALTVLAAGSAGPPAGAGTPLTSSAVEELKARIGEDWREVLVVAEPDVVAGVIKKRGGSWRARGLGVNVLRPPANVDRFAWYLDVQSQASVLAVMPNYLAQRPGNRQLSVDILEIGSWRHVVAQAAYPNLEPVPAQGVTVAIVDSRVMPVQGLGASLLPAIDVLAPDASGLTGTTAMDVVSDGCAHGTYMAVLVAAFAPGSSILPVRAVMDNCVTSAYDLARGIVAAADAGAQVISVSASTKRSSPVLAEAVKRAQARGALVVAAAGNNFTVEFPAALPGVVAMTAVGPDGWPPWYAAVGPRIDMAAPGVDVVSVDSDGWLVAVSGTSPSAALAAAAAAGIARKAPGAGWPAWGLALRQAVTPAAAISPLLEGRIGSGTLDMRLLAEAASLDTPLALAAQDGLAAP